MTHNTRIFSQELTIKLTLTILLVEDTADRFRCVLCGRNIGSIAGIPTRVSKSAIKADFNLTSSGESHPNDGVKFTSSNHGFNVSSIKISNPNSSRTAINNMYWNVLVYILFYIRRINNYRNKLPDV